MLLNRTLMISSYVVFNCKAFELIKWIAPRERPFSRGKKLELLAEAEISMNCHGLVVSEALPGFILSFLPWAVKLHRLKFVASQHLLATSLSRRHKSVTTFPLVSFYTRPAPEWKRMHQRNFPRRPPLSARAALGNFSIDNAYHKLIIYYTFFIHNFITQQYYSIFIHIHNFVT